MPGIQGSEQIHDFCSTNFADDDPIGSHPQGLPHEISHSDPSGSFDIGGPRLHAHNVRVLRLQFCGVLDDDDPFAR